MRVNWKTYNPGPFFDEIISSPGYARKPAKKLASYLRSLTQTRTAAYENRLYSGHTSNKRGIATKTISSSSGSPIRQ